MIYRMFLLGINEVLF